MQTQTFDIAVAMTSDTKARSSRMGSTALANPDVANATSSTDRAAAKGESFATQFAQQDTARATEGGTAAAGTAPGGDGQSTDVGATDVPGAVTPAEASRGDATPKIAAASGPLSEHPAARSRATVAGASAALSAIQQAFAAVDAEQGVEASEEVVATEVLLSDPGTEAGSDAAQETVDVPGLSGEGSSEVKSQNTPSPIPSLVQSALSGRMGPTEAAEPALAETDGEGAQAAAQTEGGRVGGKGISPDATQMARGGAESATAPTDGTGRTGGEALTTEQTVDSPEQASAKTGGADTPAGQMGDGRYAISPDGGGTGSGAGDSGMDFSKFVSGGRFDTPTGEEVDTPVAPETARSRTPVAAPQAVAASPAADSITSTEATDTDAQSDDASAAQDGDKARGPQGDGSAKTAAANRDSTAAMLFQMGRGDLRQARNAEAVDVVATETKPETSATNTTRAASAVAVAASGADGAEGAAEIKPGSLSRHDTKDTVEREIPVKTAQKSQDSNANPTQPQANTMAAPLMSATAQVVSETGEMLEGLSAIDELQGGGSTRAEHVAARDAASPLSAANRVDLPTRVAMQIADAARQLPDRPVEITLSPEELGKVKLSFQVSENGAMHVVVAAERADTLDLMRRNIDSLLGEFRDLGYEDSGFSFESFDQGTQDDTREGGGSGFGGDNAMPLSAHADTTTPSDAPVRVSLSSSSGMDLRL